MTTEFKRVGIIGRVKNPGVKDTLNDLIVYLISRKQDFIIEFETSEYLDANKFKTVPRQEFGQQCDLVIVVGGDGSLLNAVHAIIEDKIPVVGINRGSLGFLTDIRPTQLEKIGEILSGKFSSEKRFLLTTTIRHDNQIIFVDNALNEVALIPNIVPQMLQFEIYINHQFVCSQSSDGLIVATPTGSTAYALSGGGPILHPQLDAIVLVPMFPHTLSSRPIVIEGNQSIKLVISEDNSGDPRLSCDGQGYLTVPLGSEIAIHKKAQHLNLIHPLDYQYYETLRSKLHWGKKLIQMED